MVSLGRILVRCFPSEEAAKYDEIAQSADEIYEGPIGRVPKRVLEAVMPIDKGACKYYEYALALLYKAGWNGGTECPALALKSMCPEWTKHIVMWFPIEEDRKRYPELHPVS